MVDDLTFGAWLRRRRRALDLTRDALALRVSCSVSTLRRLEADTLRPSRGLAAALAAALELAPHDHAAFVGFARNSPASDLGALPVQTINPDQPLLPATLRSNLPIPLTRLIGREQECAAVCQLLLQADTRLLTLTGPGGVGKTRLALEVANELHDSFADGVWFVSLAPVTNPALLLLNILLALGLRELPDQTPFATLLAFLRRRRALLVLDNLDQLVEAAPQIVELITGAPQLQVLVTSRMLLRVQGEHVYGVPPLITPDLGRLPAVESLADYSAVGLFMQSAQAVQPDFVLDTTNAAAVAAICVRLDGLPLAIVLAAARTRLFAPSALLARLAHPFDLLTDGPRDLPTRQQTLRATIDWSYRLLNQQEQAFFRRVGIFVGGWTLEAAEAVADFPDQSIICTLHAAILDHSLAQAQSGLDGEPRFTLLETVREYALECLLVTGEEEQTRLRHAAYFCSLAERAEPHLRGPQQILWIDRLLSDDANLRAALSWCLDGAAPNNPALGLRLASALSWFWHTITDYTGGRRWLTLALAQPGDLHRRVRALCGAGQMAHLQDDNDIAIAWLEESLALARRIGNPSDVARALLYLALPVRKRGEFAQVSKLLTQSLEVARSCGDHWAQAYVRFLQGLVAMDQADFIAAQSLLEQARQLFLQCGDIGFVGWVYYNLGQIARFVGNLTKATAEYEQSIQIFQATYSRIAAAEVGIYTGHVALAWGDYARAWHIYRHYLPTLREMLNRRRIADCLVGMAAVLCGGGQPQWAAQLLGVAAVLRAAIAVPLSPAERPIYERIVGQVHAALSEQAFAAAYNTGQMVNWEEAVEQVLSLDVASSAPYTR